MCGCRPVPSAPRAHFTAGRRLSYRCGGDSNNLSKCWELLPVPARVLSQEESTDQMKLTLLFTQTQPWILLFTTPPPLLYLGTGCITRGTGQDHVMHHMAFSARRVAWITSCLFVSSFLMGKKRKQSYHRVTQTNKQTPQSYARANYPRSERYSVMLTLLITQCLAWSKPSNVC